jgi:hypothetical protein
VHETTGNSNRTSGCSEPRYTVVAQHDTRGAAVTGDLLTQKAKELALIPELEVSEGFVCSSGWLSNFKKHYSMESSIPLWHGEAVSSYNENFGQKSIMS